MKRTASARRAKRRTVFDRRRGQRGFALIEILVAFAILAIGLGAISAGIAIAMRSDGRSQTTRVALRVAQSRLETAGIVRPLVVGRSEGLTIPNYRWRETITAVQWRVAPPRPPEGGKPEQTAANAPLTPFWVEIEVVAADGAVARLAALKLAPAPRP
ncbi:MAG TPA: type II secretion system protein [Bradyrhizobium sp.]|jgi:general secretion pathway protein I|nr:type II secretion system protein [Bradyrhizobium sp.]